MDREPQKFLAATWELTYKGVLLEASPRRDDEIHVHAVVVAGAHANRGRGRRVRNIYYWSRKVEPTLTTSGWQMMVQLCSRLMWTWPWGGHRCGREKRCGPVALVPVQYQMQCAPCRWYDGGALVLCGCGLCEEGEEQHGAVARLQMQSSPSMERQSQLSFTSSKIGGVWSCQP